MADKRRYRQRAGGRALAVMVRAPEPGSVKTRLVPPLTFRQAARLYECFLADLFSTASTVEGVDIYAFHTPESSPEDLARMLPEGVLLLPQSGADLGERMHNIFGELFSNGYKKVALIGSDLPDLPARRINDAFDALGLDERKVILGPAGDGGYYLVAMSSPSRSIFEGIEWSTSSVLAETIERIVAAGLGYFLIDEWHDIDRPEDLALLKDNAGAPRSSGFIKSLELVP